jgi:signal peptidase II
VKRSILVFFIIFLVLFLDQWLKIWVKLNMALGENFNLLGQSWAQIYFTENKGMAFGMELGGSYGKVILSLFRIIAVFFIGYYLYNLVKKEANKGLIASISLILAGAMGNIFDSMFYGLIFSESGFHSPAVFMPVDGGYESFLHGRVVDMLHFPMVDTKYPSWFPFLGGEPLQFFRFIFNIADAAISVGVALLVIFYKRFFPNTEEEQITNNQPISTENTAVESSGTN